MTLSARLLAVTAIAALLGTSACATDPDTGQQHLSNGAIGGIGGALGGYLIGDIVGGRHDRTAKILGAGIGGIAGAGIGSYMDRQERDMRARTAGTDVRVTRQGDDLLLNIPSGINFGTDSAAIQPQFRQTLDDVAGVLHDYRSSWVDVYGHTDATGSHAHNQALSEARARAVADYLSGHGVEKARIGIRGYAETQPIEPNDTEDGRAANRRVEIKVVPIPENDLR